MERSEVTELHFITHGDNVRSIAQNGIHCHTTMSSIPHRSIALESVQDLRAGIVVPGGAALHSYANVYFDARNPMMFLVRRIHGVRELVVVRLSAELLETPGVVVTDGNAASSTTGFHDPTTELHLLETERVFAESWNAADPFIKAERKRQRCAEVLVPHGIPASAIIGLYVETQAAARACQQLAPELPAEVKPHVFFS